MEPLIVYYSSKTGNTDRFVKSLGIRAIRISNSSQQALPTISEPYILISPTYANDDGSNAVPKPVIRFLNNIDNRTQLRGVIGAGNRNFGDNFGLAARVIAKKCNVPLLYRFELSGTTTDIINVREGIKKLWDSLKQQTRQAKIRA